jgi:hypothetical protein
MKGETLVYLGSDLKALYEVLSKFNKKIFSTFNVNITNYISLSSLSMSIYRKHFLNTCKLMIIDGVVHEHIRKAYYGGLSNVYKPISCDEKLYYYDVNSLYPYGMLSSMPIGNPIHSTNRDINKIFGFVFAKIIADEDVKIPILPVRNIDGSLIAPRGE